MRRVIVSVDVPFRNTCVGEKALETAAPVWTVMLPLIAEAFFAPSLVVTALMGRLLVALEF